MGKPHVTLRIRTETGARIESKGEARHDVAMAIHLLLSGDHGNAPDRPSVSLFNSAARAFLKAVRKYESDVFSLTNKLPLPEYDSRPPCPGCWNCNEFIGKAAFYDHIGYRYKVPAMDHLFGGYEEKLTITTPCDGSGLLPRSEASP